MKTVTTTTIIALVTATFALSAAAPAFAQDMAPRNNQMQHHERSPGGHGGRMGGGFLNLSNPDRVEISLVRLSQRVDLTPEQQPLFDAFKTAAMQAAENFSGVLDTMRPAAGAQTTPDISQMLSKSIAVTTAQLEALKAVEPSATAFFDSLTDEQQAQLMPQRGKGMRHRGQPKPMTAPAAPEAPPPNG